MARHLRLPLVEDLGLGEVLQRVVLNQELHLLKERGGGGGRLVAEQQVDGGGRSGHEQLGPVAGDVVTALWVLAVLQAVCGWAGPVETHVGSGYRLS